MASMGDRVCNLECVKGSSGKEPITVREFVGPVKIILVEEAKAAYMEKSHCTGLIGIAYLLMGATNVIIMLFVCGFVLPFTVNLHVLLCTVGYQLCIPCGILMISNLNGPSSTLTLTDKRFEHTVLTVFGCVCGFAGTIAASLNGNFTLTAHCITGLIASILISITVLTGVIAYLSCCEEEEINFHKRLHYLFGVSQFVISSACFLLAIIKPRFSRWAFTVEVVPFLGLFCVIYTLVVIYTPIKQFLGRKKE